ncbi:hypothetical protein L6452_37581 [Arctium lappa]|uniref:Uncharacterized protein n=1 Tax=Arctium lappa TaxID=4217 RepID=A0ACB8Y3C3_ARCLA|nr:hypothetical protein L6452_37581 [Arctium lappa]
MDFFVCWLWSGDTARSFRNKNSKSKDRATLPSNKRRYSLSSNGMTSTNSLTIEQTSSIMKLSSGQHRLRRKTVNVSDIPTIDLTSDEELNDEQQPGDIIAGISQGDFC